ncbi:MAG: ArsR family transcriptional regulator [Rhodobacteraceae bacterium PARR1]|nr:MAG: ArsR family transcriptional regulator [Rhodobacteraceae bacterium PARR1]
MADSFAPDDPDAALRAITFLKSLSHACRLRILCSLLDRDRNVGELALALGEPQASVSQQLMRLRAEGLVRPLRQGKTVTYSLACCEVVPVITALRQAFCGQPDLAPPHVPKQAQDHRSP